VCRHHDQIHGFSCRVVDDRRGGAARGVYIIWYRDLPRWWLASARFPAEQLATLAIAGPGGAALPLFAGVAILVGFIAIGLRLAMRWFGATE
jgi:hypothetical protein